MEWTKVCAIMGPAGENELESLIQFAREGRNIAFMVPDKETGPRLKRELKERYGIEVRILNEARQCDLKELERNYDIEGFFYHGSWDDDEDIDIYRGFLEGKYGGIDYVIESAR